VVGQSIWNSLLYCLQAPNCGNDSFGRLVKTFLHVQAYRIRSFIHHRGRCDETLKKLTFWITFHSHHQLAD